MSEQFSLMAWNVQEMLGQPDYRPQVLETILRRMPDGPAVVILPDAFRELPEPVEESLGRLQQFADAEGYQLDYTPYADAVHREGQPATLAQHIVMLNRMGSQAKVVRLASRNALSLLVRHNGVDVSITGAHFDDRSEATRLAQAAAYNAHEANHVAILAGDLNSLHRDDPRARLLRSGLVVGGAQFLPGRAGSMAHRLTEMADGSTLDMLLNCNLHELDSTHQSTATIARRVKVGQLDHILYKGGISLERLQLGDGQPSDHKWLFTRVTT